MSSSYTAAVTLVQDPAVLTFGDRQATKIRVVDKAISKKAEDRFFNALLHGLDGETAKRLAKGDQILITGTLQVTSYKSKKTGQKVQADEMGFGTRILRVLKSPSFFNQNEAPETEAEAEPAQDVPGSSDGPGPLDGIHL